MIVGGVGGVVVGVGLDEGGWKDGRKEDCSISVGSLCSMCCVSELRMIVGGCCSILVS